MRFGMVTAPEPINFSACRTPLTPQGVPPVPPHCSEARRVCGTLRGEYSRGGSAAAMTREGGAGVSVLRCWVGHYRTGVGNRPRGAQHTAEFSTVDSGGAAPWTAPGAAPRPRCPGGTGSRGVCPQCPPCPLWSPGGLPQIPHPPPSSGRCVRPQLGVARQWRGGERELWRSWALWQGRGGLAVGVCTGKTPGWGKHPPSPSCPGTFTFLAQAERGQVKLVQPGSPHQAGSAEDTQDEQS